MASFSMFMKGDCKNKFSSCFRDVFSAHFSCFTKRLRNCLSNIVWMILFCSNSVIAASPGVLQCLESDLPKWEISIEIQGQDSAFAESMFFDFEIIGPEGDICQVFNATASEITSLLKSYQKKVHNTEMVRVILLNRDFMKIKHQAGNQPPQIKYSEEITLKFYGATPVKHHIHFMERDVLNFIYVETSGGIRNIRHLRNHVERVLEKEEEFLIYYHGASGPMIIDSEELLTRFYNMVFTAITQPPMPGEELRNVMQTFQEKRTESWNLANLQLSFYMGEISYQRLMDLFVKPFKRYLSEEYAFWQIHTVVYTDFDVSEKSKKIRYVNIYSE